jgi:mRNA interferase ChpB
MWALPPAVLDMLNLKAGATVGSQVVGGRLVIEPTPRPHYTLAELLAASDYTEPLTDEGREQRGFRPVAIASATAANEATKLPVVLPITRGGAFARHIGFAVPIAGIETTGVVRCDQPQAIDLAARNGRRVGSLPPSSLAEVLAKVRPIFE